MKVHVREPLEIRGELGKVEFRVTEHEAIAIPPALVLADGDDGLFGAVTGAGLVKAEFRKGKLFLQAGPFVGRVQVLPGLALLVEPRFSIGNLAEILAYVEAGTSRKLKQRRTYGLEAGYPGNFLELLTEELVAGCEKVLRLGLHTEEVGQELDTSSLGGRLLIGTTIDRWWARNIRYKVASVQYVETFDTAPNRCLKFAMDRLWSSLVDRRSRIGRRLGRVMSAFRGIPRDRERTFLEGLWDWGPEQFRGRFAHYEQVLPVALLICRAETIDVPSVGVSPELGSIFIRMDEVFEVLVRRSLAEVLVPWGISVLDGNRQPPHGAAVSLFENGGARLATPDAVLRKDGGAVVVEVKYKNFPGAPGRDDLNQLVTYAVRFGAKSAVVVSPLVDAAHDRRSFLGRIGGTSVFHYKFDLDGGLARESEALGAFMQELPGLTSLG